MSARLNVSVSHTNDAGPSRTRVAVIGDALRLKRVQIKRSAVRQQLLVYPAPRTSSGNCGSGATAAAARVYMRCSR